MEGRVRCLGVWLCVCLAACQVRANYVPSEMNRTIQNLVDHYVSRPPPTPPPHTHTAPQGPARWVLPSVDSLASKFPGGVRERTGEPKLHPRRSPPPSLNATPARGVLMMCPTVCECTV